MAGAQFFDSIRRAGIYRPDGGRWFAGVSAGVARRSGIDTILVRGIFVALTVLGGVGLLLYGLAWLFLPQDDGRIHAQQVLSGDVTAGFFGALVVSCLGLGADGGGGPFGWYGYGFPGGLVLTVLIVGGIFYWASRNQGRPWPGQRPAAGQPYPSQPYPNQPYTSNQPYTPAPPYNPPYSSETRSEAMGSGPGTAAGTSTATLPPVTQPYGSPPPPGSNPGGYPYPYPPSDRPSRRLASAPSKRITRATFGLALLAGVGGFLAAGAGSDDTGEQVLIGMTVALGVLALGVIVSGLLGRRSAGLAGLGVLLAVATLIGTAAHNEGIARDQSFVVAGQRVWTPVNTVEANDGISQGVGELDVNLTEPGLFAASGDRVTVPVRMGAGRIVLTLPDSVPAEITVEQGGGQVTDITGETRETRGGADHQLTYRTGPDGDPRLIVRVRQGAGEIEMRTQASTADGADPSATPAVTPSATPAVTPSATPTGAK